MAEGGLEPPAPYQYQKKKHSGFVINRGGATCQDVLTLVKQVQECVFAQTGVRLEMEVKLLPSEW